MNVQDKNKQNVDLILTRLKSAAKISSNIEMAKKMNVSNQAISNWIKRNSIDYELVFTICLQYNINIDWVITGNGSMFTVKTQPLSQEEIQKNEAPQSKAECEACKRYERTVNALLDQIESLRDELHEYEEKFDNLKKKAG